MKRVQGNIKLKQKCFAVALSSILAQNEAHAQSKSFQSDTLRFWTQKEVLNFKSFKFLTTDGYRIISETKDTLLLERISSIVDCVPLKIFVEKYDESHGRIFVIVNGHKHLLKIESNYMFYQDGNFRLELKPNGNIHKTYKIGHSSHSSHSSHHSHYSQISTDTTKAK